MRSISRVVPVIIAGIAGMGAGVGIGLLAASHGSVGTLGGTVTSGVEASSAQWAAEGARLVRETHGNWAYESIPIDVVGNGTYFFDFGPVPQSFNYPSNPKGMAFDWPPDSHFSVVPANTCSVYRDPSRQTVFPDRFHACRAFRVLIVVIEPGFIEQHP